jgi:uracil-DNA glycosylase
MQSNIKFNPVLCELCGSSMAGPPVTPASRRVRGEMAVMVVGEAPGRLGAARTRVPFSGDQTGRNFEALLEAAGLQRDDLVITNAVLCNPISEDGCNRRPTQAEIKRCVLAHLGAEVDRAQPQLVMTLGAVALGALRHLEEHGLELSTGVGQVVPWNGRLLAPLFHPSPRVVNTRRSLAAQADDWRSALLKAKSMTGTEPSSDLTAR